MCGHRRGLAITCANNEARANLTSSIFRIDMGRAFETSNNCFVGNCKSLCCVIFNVTMAISVFVHTISSESLTSLVNNTLMV